MSLPSLRRVPESAVQWDRFHWNHYLDHKQILAVITKKTGIQQLMPPIWPVRDNDWDAKLSYFHQNLHTQMNILSGDTSYDFLRTDLSTGEGRDTFIETNYANHFAFVRLVGVPV